MRRELQVVRGLRERHRVAGERNRDRGRQLHPLGVLGREQEREERIVLTFEREDPVVARGLDRGRRGGDGAEIGNRQRGVDLEFSC